MEQTFYDICRARGSSGRGVFGLALWLCAETVGGIMNEHIQLLSVRHNSIARAALVTAVVLLIPLWGVLFVDGWNWPWQAFVRWGAIVFSFALTYQLVVRAMRNWAYKFALGLAMVTAFVLTWTNFVLMADANVANAMYFGVPIIAFVGAAIARLRASGMAVALLVTAIAQMLVPVIALVFLKTHLATGGGGDGGGVVGLNHVFIVLFATSAWWFRRAALTHEMSPTRSE